MKGPVADSTEGRNGRISLMGTWRWQNRLRTLVTRQAKLLNFYWLRSGLPNPHSLFEILDSPLMEVRLPSFFTTVPYLSFNGTS